MNATIKGNLYKIGTMESGRKFVYVDSVTGRLHITTGNSKTGTCLNYNTSVFYTCNHACECYKKGRCYALGGCYNFLSNQLDYAENYKFFIENSSDVFCAAVNAEIAAHKNIHLFRWFTCGDICNSRFLECMVQIAIDNPGVKFWAYTKRYNIVNAYIDNGGILPENLTILFSHWMNCDGSYFPMPNPHNMPTSEFIPMGKEDLLESVTHVCPCSDPNFTGTCATCDHPCHSLKSGECMALCEHSTSETRERDKELKAAKAAAKEAKKGE